jgi:hypothetical protein
MDFSQTIDELEHYQLFIYIYIYSLYVYIDGPIHSWRARYNIIIRYSGVISRYIT